MAEVEPSTFSPDLERAFRETIEAALAGTGIEPAPTLRALDEFLEEVERAGGLEGNPSYLRQPIGSR